MFAVPGAFQNLETRITRIQQLMHWLWVWRRRENLEFVYEMIRKVRQSASGLRCKQSFRLNMFQISVYGVVEL